MQTVDYARSIEEQYGKKFRFTITTNGLLLDEDKRAYINANMDNVVLSLDGRRCGQRRRIPRSARLSM